MHRLLKNCKVSKDEDHETMLSYGYRENGKSNILGKYYILPSDLSHFLTTPCINGSSVLDNYAFVEKKTPYYILMLDFERCQLSVLN